MADAAAATDVAATYAAVTAGVSTTVRLLDHHSLAHTSKVNHFALISPGSAGVRADVIAVVNKQSAVHGRKYIASGNVSPFRTPISHAITKSISHAHYARSYQRHLYIYYLFCKTSRDTHKDSTLIRECPARNMWRCVWALALRTHPTCTYTHHVHHVPPAC